MTRLLQLLNTPFVKFLAVGVLNTAFGYVLYAVLVLAGLGPQAALALAFACGVVWNYFTHARLVFATKGAGRLPAYALVYLGLYGVNAAGLAGLLAIGLDPILAQAVLVLPAAALSFVFISRVLTDRFPWDPKRV
ncbi:MAG: GtrA family protein [Rhodobacteraceae bacterium]|nr:GtrA family protein [Paracoccaceae bacterium]